MVLQVQDKVEDIEKDGDGAEMASEADDYFSTGDEAIGQTVKFVKEQSIDRYLSFLIHWMHTYLSFLLVNFVKEQIIIWYI